MFNFDKMYRLHHPTCNDNWYKICDDWNYEYQTRSLAPEETINPEDRIVLCVGDSFTFGDGVYYKDTWSNKLQETVLKDYKVINVGIRGASNDFITNVLSNWCSKYGNQIEIVIAGMTFSYRRTYYKDGQPNNLSVGFVGKDKQKWFKDIHSSFINMQNEENDKENYNKNILLIRGLGKICNFKTYWWDVESQINPNFVSDIHSNKLFDDRDFTYIPLKMFSANSKEERDVYYISKDDRHWSSEGHTAIANMIAKYI